MRYERLHMPVNRIGFRCTDGPSVSTLDFTLHPYGLAAHSSASFGGVAPIHQTGKDTIHVLGTEVLRNDKWLGIFGLGFTMVYQWMASGFLLIAKSVIPSWRFGLSSNWIHVRAKITMVMLRACAWNWPTPDSLLLVISRGIARHHSEKCGSKSGTSRIAMNWGLWVLLSLQSQTL